jgi:hypothetical protein
VYNTIDDLGVLANATIFKKVSSNTLKAIHRDIVQGAMDTNSIMRGYILKIPPTQEKIDEYNTFFSLLYKCYDLT